MECVALSPPSSQADSPRPSAHETHLFLTCPGALTDANVRRVTGAVWQESAAILGWVAVVALRRGPCLVVALHSHHRALCLAVGDRSSAEPDNSMELTHRDWDLGSSSSARALSACQQAHVRRQPNRCKLGPSTLVTVPSFLYAYLLAIQDCHSDC